MTDVDKVIRKGRTRAAQLLIAKAYPLNEIMDMTGLSLQDLKKFGLISFSNF